MAETHLTQAELAEDAGPGIQAGCIAIIVLEVVAVALRFLSRALANPQGGSKFWWDDWTCLLALPLCVAVPVNVAIQTHIGLGKHVQVIPKDQVYLQLKRLWIGYYLYQFALTITRTSALFFLTRIFVTDHPTRLRHFILATHIFNFTWLGVFTIVVSTICIPIQKYWQPWLEGHCMNTNAVWLGSAITGVTADIMILLLPMPMLWRLHSTLTRKVLLTGIFILSYGVAAVSIGRVVVIHQIGPKMELDMTWYVIVPIYWSVVEPPLALVSCCLPAIYLLFRHIRKSSYFSRLLPSSKRNQGSDSEGGKSDESDSSIPPKPAAFSSKASKLYTGPKEKGVSECRIDANKNEKEAIIGDRSSAGIYVQRGVDVESEAGGEQSWRGKSSS